MDEALVVELLAVHALGRELAAEGASERKWAAYRAWRDRVIAEATLRMAA